MRPLLRSSAFIRSAKRTIKKNPDLADDIRRTLQLLSDDAFDPRLQTHKLKGKLKGAWACSAGYDLRIVFEFVQDQGEE